MSALECACTSRVSSTDHKSLTASTSSDSLRPLAPASLELLMHSSTHPEDPLFVKKFRGKKEKHDCLIDFHWTLLQYRARCEAWLERTLAAVAMKQFGNNEWLIHWLYSVPKPKKQFCWETDTLPQPRQSVPLCCRGTKQSAGYSLGWVWKDGWWDEGKEGWREREEQALTGNNYRDKCLLTSLH